MPIEIAGFSINATYRKELGGCCLTAGHFGLTNWGLLSYKTISDAGNFLTKEYSHEKRWFRQKQGLRRYIGPKRVVITLLFSASLVVLWYLRKHGYLTPETVFQFVHDYPVWGPVIFVTVYLVSVVALIPTLPFNLGAGFLWGPLWGTVFSVAGSGLGAMTAFIIARTAVGQPLARRFDNAMAQWLQKELATKGWRVVAFTRINPVFPSGPLNFILAMTSITFPCYAWSSLVFMTPLALVFSIIGHSVGGFILDGEAARLVRLVMMISLSLVVLMVIMLLSRRLLGKTTLPR
jgi:uncharacterized membrane protein YdjX (TVP38/TMEM64 family)